MLYDMSWLQKGRKFPPPEEENRINRYIQNAALFDGDHFSNTYYRHRGEQSSEAPYIEMYQRCASRISKVVGNFSDVISFPVLLNYQRLMSLKMADLVCGEHPTITAGSKEENLSIKNKRMNTMFDSKLYSAVIDMSRYGDAVMRIYLDSDTKERTFTMWDPVEWYPIVSQDGTLTILKHCLCWRENLEPDSTKAPKWRLKVQVHDTKDVGYYDYYEFKLDSYGGTIISQVGGVTRESTGLDVCAVDHLKAFSVTNNIYGYDDYMPIDSILAEVMERVGQISAILDKHADPNITGPASMLKIDPLTGERYLATGKFFATSPGEEQPKYMTWEGQLEPSFKELEFLLNQLYILSEMGAALIGDAAGGSQVISGTALRFKMASPLAKARRIANALTAPVTRLFSILIPDIDVDSISIKWADGLPDDPREVIELIKLVTGKTSILPLQNALMEYLNKSQDEVDAIMSTLEEEAQKAISQDDPNKPGPQDGTGVNPQAKGSTTGLSNFKSDSNKTPEQ